MKKTIVVIALILCIAGTAFLLTGCTKNFKKDTRTLGWERYDLTAPNLETDTIYNNQADALANGGGWYWTLKENFETYNNVSELLYDPVTNPDSIWAYSPHNMRTKPDAEADKNPETWQNKNKDKSSWWCPSMLDFDPISHQVLVRAKQFTTDNPHTCPNNICPKVGRMTSGIETRTYDQVEGESTYLYAQAFGYYEARVKFPNADGMWSAFWLQTNSQGKLGNDGMDGTEIDVYESAFRLYNEGGSMMGHALLWDGYASGFSKVDGPRFILNDDLYDGYHTFGLKWTPTHYVFYIDGVPTWATNAGGVSRVEEFLRLTTEIDTGDEFGPHGAKIGPFRPAATDDTTFYIDHVYALQHTAYEGSILGDDFFSPTLS